ncbi:hypothetical protein [Bordetella bronchialis]|uniref:Uncharacterized protein n=1 Tax=Bordetella bronchialis TaxID=463025 RepID=A0A193FV24_9BORD|nr:hypothetical protein [Bordetella bronchialis]ANN70894.1 hypothetical protein BAU08_05710 [Bordetella bronchialis]
MAAFFGAIFYFGLLIAGLVGWIFNIGKLVHVGMPLAQWGVIEVLRAIGILLAPLGAVLGYC